MKDEVNRSYDILVRAHKRGLPDGAKSCYVLVSHSELDNLVGRLMQMCELVGDLEQRAALKSTIKNISRDWLDDAYDEAGYDKWSGVREGITPVEI